MPRTPTCHHPTSAMMLDQTAFKTRLELPGECLAELLAKVFRAPCYVLVAMVWLRDVGRPNQSHNLIRFILSDGEARLTRRDAQWGVGQLQHGIRRAELHNEAPQRVTGRATRSRASALLQCTLKSLQRRPLHLGNSL